MIRPSLNPGPKADPRLTEPLRAAWAPGQSLDGGLVRIEPVNVGSVWLDSQLSELRGVPRGALALSLCVLVLCLCAALGLHASPFHLEWRGERLAMAADD